MNTLSLNLKKYISLTVAITLVKSQTSFASPARDVNSFAPQSLNSLSLEAAFDKDLVLNDYKNKISEDFKIPNEFKPRVSFWFDIYTKFSAQEEVVHHAEFPWIVFKVIDLRPILNAEGNKWTKYHKSKKFSKDQTALVRSTLKKLSQKSNYKNLKGFEKEVFDKLSEIPGKRKTVIKNALNNIRRQVGQRDFILQGIEQSTLYLEKIEEIFEANNLPRELTRLPFVESSFNPKAVSKVGASGIWQVMPFIGKKFLVMNDHIDERNSPVKSAKAAAFILKENRMILRNWPLALTAYNHGAGSLQRAVKTTGTRDILQIIKKYRAPSFGFASQNFYASFLAILHAEKYKQETFKLSPTPRTLEFTELKLSQRIKVKEFLKISGLSQEDFQELNLDIKKTAFQKNAFLPRGYVVHVPKESVSLIKSKNQKLASIVDSEKNMKLKL